MKEVELTNEQRELLCRMIGEAFCEVRNLVAVGHSEQAFALVDAFHSLPFGLFRPDFSVERARMEIGSYQKKYPRIIKGNCVFGSYNDYLAMFDEITALNQLKDH